MINGFFIKEIPKPLIQHYSTSKLHKCVKYDLITTNYATLNAIPQLNLSRNPYYIHEYYHEIHGIVFLNKSILYTSVHLRMENNAAEKSFHFRYTKKSFLIFRVPKIGCFVKQLQKYVTNLNHNNL